MLSLKGFLVPCPQLIRPASIMTILISIIKIEFACFWTLYRITEYVLLLHLKPFTKLYICEIQQCCWVHSFIVLVIVIHHCYHCIVFYCININIILNLLTHSMFKGTRVYSIMRPLQTNLLLIMPFSQFIDYFEECIIRSAVAE